MEGVVEQWLTFELERSLAALRFAHVRGSFELQAINDRIVEDENFGTNVNKGIE